MKLYVVSDVHGHFKEFKDCVCKAGYNSSDRDSLLVVLGDNFDRGEESLEMFNYLKQLTKAGKAIVLHGNHEDFIIDFLNGKDCWFNFVHNGFNKTLDSFLGQTRSWEMFCMYCSEEPDLAREMYGKVVEPLLGDYYSIPIEVRFDIFQEYARKYIKRKHRSLLPWLNSLPYYYETENYIFTHASIDGMCDDWHKPNCRKYNDWTPWQSLTWDNGSFYVAPVYNTNKTVVVGHFHTDGIREIYNLPKGEVENEILYTYKKIFIDTCTVLTKRVNVLILEDNIEKEIERND